MPSSRREFCVALSMLAAAMPALADSQDATKKTLPSKMYDFDKMPQKQNGPALARAIFSGKLYEGCEIDMHESVLAPNSAPHAPHKHRHEEMVFVAEGKLEFTVGGKATLAPEGSVLFAGSNDLHGIRNPTAEPARYFVLALGSGKD